jgi:uncharacterized membrane protein YccF (DUF307 family)
MLLLRLIYFLVIGLWLSSIWVTVAWVLCVTILGLPIGLWMLNKLPQIATLQPERQDLTITTEGRIYQMHKPQPNFFLRAIYFLLIGWWFSALWLSVAWALSASILGLPIAFWMFNRVPGVITLANT